MNQTIRLPFSSWHAKPGLGDPAHGYFVRLVAEGYHVSGRVYANELEINGRNIVLKEILNELLALPITEDQKQSLTRWTPVWNGRHHCLSDQTLRKRQMSFYDRRFCRACLAEAPHHCAWWDIVAFHVCPLHSTPIEQETAAGDRIKWWWPSFDTSPDGEYLPRRLPRSEEPDDFEWYVLSTAGFRPPDWGDEALNFRNRLALSTADPCPSMRVPRLQRVDMQIQKENGPRLNRGPQALISSRSWIKARIERRAHLSGSSLASNLGLRPPVETECFP